MLVDDVTIRVKTGSGGKGAVGFAKTKMTLGPTGARGGNGGSVYLEAVNDFGALRRFRAAKVFAAENGQDGRTMYRDGRDGADLILRVPRGTLVHDLTGGTEHETLFIGEKILIAKGGRGGKGNFHYKSSRHTSPTKSQPGFPGEEYVLHLTLKLIADIGLVGLPNVGKSSFLNMVTNAQSHVANYPFTTLEPHLGVYEGLVLADLPGLIEGASAGKGLGIKFLRHIERTKILFHFIDVNTEDPVRDHNIIRGELGAYNPALLEKPEYLLITKIDTVEKKRIVEVKNALSKHLPNKEIVMLSLAGTGEMADACKLLNQIAQLALGPESTKISHAKRG